MPPTYYDNEPLVKISFVNTVDEYCFGRVTAAKRFGILRYNILQYIIWVLFSGLMVYRILKMFGVFGNGRVSGGLESSFYIVLIGFILIVCLIQFLIGPFQNPDQFTQKATFDYEQTQLPSLEREIELYRDSYIVTTKAGTVTGDYARELGCIETKTLLILVPDEQSRLVIIPKKALGESLSAATEILKTGYFRRYSVVTRGDL